jgi:hypothetical protein
MGLTKNEFILEVYGGLGRNFGENSLGAYPRIRELAKDFNYY